MICIIGIGIEGKSSLSQRALGLIKGASVLVGGRRHLACFPEFKGSKMPIGSNLYDVLKALNLKSQVINCKSAVILATGDPNFFGIADFIIKKFGKKSVEIIPNVSSLQAAFARIKENWNDARFLSLHGRDGNIDDAIDEIIKYAKVGILTDPENTPSKIAKAMVDKGITHYKTYVCEDLGTEKERVTQGTLKQIAGKKFSPLNVMVLIKQGQGSGVRGQKTACLLPPPEADAPCPCSFGIPDSAFSHSNGMITKEEIRVISLSKLKLKNDSILWDIGAGSGSLSVEAALLARDGKVFAIEKEKLRVTHIERNKKRFAATNLEVINKNALDVLKGLATPDAVFVGGGGRDISKILAVCSKRIRRGGRMVINAIGIETLTGATEFFKKAGWNTETISVNISKTKDVAGLHLFNAHNPIFIITGERP